MKKWLELIKHPERFHVSPSSDSKLHKKNYFEGWYFKHVTSDGTQSIAFIPGISLDHTDTHSFVQVITSDAANQVRTDYHRFPAHAFSWTDEPFSVRVAENTFSLTGCQLHLPNLTASFTYGQLAPIKSSRLHPNIMGAFAYVPKMECNHGILSMHHTIDGQVTNYETITQLREKSTLSRVIDFTSGRGYMEKDWGTSFPSSYIWVQANHFEDPDTAFMVSVAHIPFGLFSFTGVIANLHYKGKEYRFATYNRAKITRYDVHDQRLAIALTRHGDSVLCEAVIAAAGTLKAPEQGEMRRTIKEGLGGTVTLTLNLKGESPVTLTSTAAGIEIVK